MEEEEPFGYKKCVPKTVLKTCLESVPKTVPKTSLESVPKTVPKTCLESVPKKIFLEFHTNSLRLEIFE
jgi:hypothetical protein